MAYSTDDIRNIALVGHAGAGKTLLAEALLHGAGAVPQRGEPARGAAILDHDPLARELGHSVDTALAYLDHAGRRINLVDTPGTPDLLGRSLGVLAAVETAGLVLRAGAGIELGARRMMEAAVRRRLCRIVIVSHMDAAPAALPGLLAQLRDAFGRECLPVNLPADAGARVLDCFFSAEGPPTDFGSVADAHRALVEQVVEVDEALVEKYLEGDSDIAPEQLHDTFERALREGHLVPVCFVSARTGAGVPELLDFMAKLLPSPREGNPPAFLKGEGAAAVPVGVIPGPGGHALAHVFKVTIDPYVGRIAAFRVHQGTVRPGMPLYVGDARKPVRLAHLHQLRGKELVECRAVVAGDLGAVTKQDELHVGAVLHDSHDEDHHHLPAELLPAAMLGIALEPVRHGDEQKISDALHKLTAEDASVRVEHHPSLNETVLYGLGEMHLRVALDKMKRQYHAEFTTRPPRVPYRETVARPAEGHCRHKKQTGGAGQFGEVFLRVEPRERGAGFEFVDAVTGGAIPSQFIPAVEKGVRQVLASGAIAGFPLEDLRVTVTDGKTHPVDGKEVAFTSAGRKGFIDAVQKARPLVLEPMMNAFINAPVRAIGAITGDLTGMRGRIGAQSVLSDSQALIEAQVPLAELRDYHHKLKSHTAGEGSFTLEFSHYEPVPARLQQELAAAYEKRRQPDTE